MAKIIDVYTTKWCPYCKSAKSLLDQLGHAYREIDIEEAAGAREEMLERSKGARSVPQIFVGDVHVGGCDDLHALHAKGGLAPLVGENTEQ